MTTTAQLFPIVKANKKYIRKCIHGMHTLILYIQYSLAIGFLLHPDFVSVSKYHFCPLESVYSQFYHLPSVGVQHLQHVTQHHLPVLLFLFQLDRMTTLTEKHNATSCTAENDTELPVL